MIVYLCPRVSKDRQKLCMILSLKMIDTTTVGILSTLENDDLPSLTYYIVGTKNCSWEWNVAYAFPMPSAVLDMPC